VRDWETVLNIAKNFESSWSHRWSGRNKATLQAQSVSRDLARKRCSNKKSIRRSAKIERGRKNGVFPLEFLLAFSKRKHMIERNKIPRVK
jgi:hypothetical protein